MNPTENECFLYRHFDKEKNLLYVGISLSAIHRLKQHYDRSVWAREITYVTIEEFPSRRKALEAESTAIQIENPKHNIKCRKPNIRKMKTFSRECQIRIDPNKYFDINGNFVPGGKDKWNEFKANSAINNSYAFWERIKSVESRMAETSEFVENYNTDYPSGDGKFRSVNALIT